MCNMIMQFMYSTVVVSMYWISHIFIFSEVFYIIIIIIFFNMLLLEC